MFGDAVLPRGQHSGCVFQTVGIWPSLKPAICTSHENDFPIFLLPYDCGPTGEAGLDLNMMSRSIEGSTQNEETISTMENGMETLDANTLLFSVKGMTCGSCAAHIERAVREVPGVVDVIVDRPKNQVRIKTSADTGQADVFVRAIALAGYVAQRVAP
ncbi:heavy-metal-associated domain-containing protein [Sphingomonas koreensis]|uniref:heavy-metal-associated domain-containing protein n=1 Tax=Sphingomonas koreensis TaxID=93064 RepID=UPI00234F2171|nr:heavy metal-associated domain-containing protein [Sphingomonas koreensis]MDC7810175.1 heavy metal-associated domain-containing protein [Sphingomonas koreensis]